MAAPENKEVIRAIYKALESGDGSVFAASVTPDYIWRFPSKMSWSARYSGRHEVQTKLLDPLYARFGGTYTARAINLVGEGDTVVAEIEGHVVTTDGKTYDNQYCMLFHFRDGKVAEIVEYCDTALIENVLGPYDRALASVDGSRR